jgi:hypothetical protein
MWFVLKNANGDFYGGRDENDDPRLSDLSEALIFRARVEDAELKVDPELPDEETWVPVPVQVSAEELI